MASFNNNSALFLSLLVAFLAFMAAPSSVEAQIPGSPPILPVLPRLLNISGPVFCTPNVTVSANGTDPSNAQPVSDATVMLRCNITLPATTNLVSDIRASVSLIPDFGGGIPYVVSGLFRFLA